MSQSTTSLLLKITAVLWVIWGLVHLLAGVLTIWQDTPHAFSAIADAVDPAVLTGPYHEAVGAVVNQHGFNFIPGTIMTLISLAAIILSLVVYVMAMSGQKRATN